MRLTARGGGGGGSSSREGAVTIRSETEVRTRSERRRLEEGVDLGVESLASSWLKMRNKMRQS